jgi:hypothetical protein
VVLAPAPASAALGRRQSVFASGFALPCVGFRSSDPQAGFFVQAVEFDVAEIESGNDTHNWTPIDDRAAFLLSANTR